MFIFDRLFFFEADDLKLYFLQQILVIIDGQISTSIDTDLRLK